MSQRINETLKHKETKYENWFEFDPDLLHAVTIVILLPWPTGKMLTTADNIKIRNKA